ncbi:MAG: hypothetical protein WBW49_15810, partial [Candidatus Acidiferrum sp.]
LKACLTSCAQFSLAHRVFRITCQFLGQPHFDEPELAVPENFSLAFHHTHLDSAAGRAHRTNTWLPDCYPWHKIFFGYELDELHSSVAAPLDRKGGTGQGGKTQECSAFHG